MIKGYLREMSAELIGNYEGQRNCCINFYIFQCEDGKIIEHVDNVSDAPTNIKIGIDLKDGSIISWDYLEDTVFSNVNRMIKDIALVRVVPVGRLNDFERQKVEQGAKDLEDYFKKINDGLWTHVSVTPYVIENIERQSLGPFSYNFGMVADRLRPQHPEKFDQHNYWHGWGGSHKDYLGLAGRNGSRCWTWAAGERTMRHEQGHCFGCPHSTTKEYEYGDPTCNMAKALTGFNATQMVRLGQIKSEYHDISDANKSDTYYLCPVEVNNRDVRQGELKSLLLDAGSRYTLGLSTRKAASQSWLGYGDEGTLSIHEIPIDHLNNLHGSPVYLTEIREGEKYTWNDTVVQHAGVKDGVVKVEVNSPTKTTDYPTTLPSLSGSELTTKHSAIWHDPQYKYQGIDLHVIPERNKVIGYWFSHHPQGETRRDIITRISSRQWFVIDGDIDPETNNVDCVILSTYDRSVEQDGYGTIRLDNGELKFRFYTKSYGRDSIALKPLSVPKDDKISGIYETGKYEGFSVGKYDGLYVAYNFTYGAPQSLNLEWEVYQGTNINDLQGYRMDARYKISYKTELEELGTLDLQEIIDSAEKVY